MVADGVVAVGVDGELQLLAASSPNRANACFMKLNCTDAVISTKISIL